MKRTIAPIVSPRNRTGTVSIEVKARRRMSDSWPGDRAIFRYQASSRSTCIATVDRPERQASTCSCNGNGVAFSRTSMASSSCARAVRRTDSPSTMSKKAKSPSVGNATARVRANASSEDRDDDSALAAWLRKYRESVTGAV